MAVTLQLSGVYTNFKIIIISLSIIHLHHCRIWSSAGQVCRTRSCVELARMYKENINTKVKPCDDFFSYVCGNWDKRISESYADSLATAFDLLSVTSKLRLKLILESKKIQPRNKATDLVVKVYKACMNIPHFGMKNSRQIKKIIIQSGYVPMFAKKNIKLKRTIEWWNIDKYYLKLTGESALFDNYVFAIGESGFITLTAMQSAYGAITSKTFLTENEKEKYIDFLQAVVNNIDSEVNVLMDIRQIMKFREELEKKIQKFEQTGGYPFKTMPIHELNTNYKKQGISQLDWLQQILAISQTRNDPNGFAINKDTVVNIHVEYFVKLFKILQNFPEDTIVNHIHLYFLERHLLLPSIIKEKLQKLAFANSKQQIRFTRDRWYTCIQSHNMLKHLEEIYTAKYLSMEIKSSIRLLHKELKSQLKYFISRSPWVDRGTKNIIQSKIDSQEILIGFSELENKLGAKKSLNLLSIDARSSYILEENMIYVTSMFLHQPAYSENVPYPIDYGSMGFIIGHEMYHNFDTINQSDFLWPSNMLQKYEKRVKNIVRFYNQMKTMRLNKFNTNINLNDTRSSEDISDSMGLKLAYAAFERRLSKENNICSVLPELEFFTCEQLFFMAYGNIVCGSSKEFYELVFFEGTDYSPPSIRLNAVVANMKEFHEAFKCQPDNRLYMPKTYDLWQK